MWIAPVSARINPAATESTEIERMVPCISPERAAASASSPPLSSSASPKPTSMRGLYRQARARRNAVEIPLVEQLRHLDGVGRRALAQVVADDPEVEAALMRGVAADPADQDLVSAG